MKKIWRVAVTEFSNSIRSKGFIIGLLAMPIMLIVMGVVQTLAMDHTDTSERKFAVVDRSGEMYSVLAKAATERAKKGGGKNFTPFSPIEISQPSPSIDDLVLELSEKVRAEEIFAFVVIESSILDKTVANDSLKYYSSSPLYDDLPIWIRAVIEKDVQQRRFDKAGLDSVEVKQLVAKVPIERLGLAKRGSGGKVQKAAKEDEIRTTVVPMVSMLLLYMLLMTCTPTLLTSVMEEKMNKISEFLVSAITPFQLLMGKLIGVLMVSLVLSTLYLCSMAVVASSFGVLDTITPVKVVTFYLFLILGGLMLGAVCVAIGAACNEIRDSQSLMFPVMMIAMFPIMIWVPVMQMPDGWFARIFSLIPPFTPMLMLLRISVPPGVPAWELILGFALTTGFAILCVMAAGKIFRVGILSQGQTPSFGKMLRWLMSK